MREHVELDRSHSQCSDRRTRRKFRREIKDDLVWPARITVERPNSESRSTFMSITGQKIKVAVVDDHTVFREGIRKILSLEKDIEIVGEAYDGDEVITLLS